MARGPVVMAAALAIAVAGGVWLATSRGTETTRRLPHPAPTTTTALPAATTTTRIPGPPFAVGLLRLTVEDTTRGTMARGPTPASATRRLPLTVHYPAVGEGAEAVENAAPAPGQFPLVIFAHGYAITASAYDVLTRDLAAGGFIVVAPDFPISSLVFPGPASQLDIPNQTGDVSFLITVFQTPTSAPSLLQGHVAPEKAGVTGHSDGGVTAAGVSGNSCCFDARVGASAALAGDQGGGLFRGSWGLPDASPQLFIHGTADRDVPYSFSQKLYDDTRSSKLLVSIPGGAHLEPFTTGSQRPAIVNLILDFFRAHLQSDTAAAARIPADANVEGVLKLEAAA